jgi:pimeloyl-ACP methyl ester carboxylesterase
MTTPARSALPVSRTFHLEVEEAQLHVTTYVNDPQARWLVLLHDSLGSIGQWKTFPAQLLAQTGCNVLLYEREGFGESTPRQQSYFLDYMHYEADIVLPDILAAVGVTCPILIGHGEGGSIALLYAALFPAEVAGVVALAAYAVMDDQAVAGVHLAQSLYRSADLRSKLVRHHGSQTDELFQRWSTAWLSPEFSSWEIETELHHVRCPVLLIQGDVDECVSAEQMRIIAHHVSGSVETLLIPNCAHVPHRQASTMTVEAIGMFVAGLAWSGSSAWPTPS